MSDNLDLNLLRVFDALVHEASVTGASERLQLSIPAASRALGRLRRAVDDPILVRAGRGMAPTPYALRAAPRVRALLDEAAAVMSADREFVPAQLRRSFTIRINDGTSAVLAPPLVAAVAAAAPQVSLRFVAEGDESTDALRDGSVDLDVGVADAAPDVHVALLYREHQIGVVHRDSTLGRGRRPTAAQLCRHPHVVSSRRGRARGPMDDALATLGLRRTVAAVVPNFPAAMMLAASGGLVAMGPHRVAEAWAATFGLRWFSLPVELPETEISMSWHARLDADPAQRWLRETIRAAAA